MLSNLGRIPTRASCWSLSGSWSWKDNTMQLIYITKSQRYRILDFDLGPLGVSKKRFEELISKNSTKPYQTKASRECSGRNASSLYSGSLGETAKTLSVVPVWMKGWQFLSERIVPWRTTCYRCFDKELSAESCRTKKSTKCLLYFWNHHNTILMLSR